MKESRLQTRAKAWLEANGFETWINHGSAWSKSGLPDLMAVRDGRLVAIELKRPGGGDKPTKIQLYRLARFRRAGAVAFWSDDLNEIRSKILTFFPDLPATETA